MSEQTRRGRAVRWGVPIATIALVAGAIGAGPVIAAVQGDPVLPERTAAQLLADAVQATESGLKPMSGTVMQTASLGLPGLPEVAGMGGTSPAALLAGSHELKVWYGGEDRFRFALPGRMSETDLIVNGDQAWLWESATNKATRIKGAGQAGPEHDRALPAATTPQQVADEMLKRADAATAVSVSNTEKVAGRSAYQLVLTPRDGSSLVKEVKLALDGETFVPLRVQVYAKSAAEPAFEVGFTSVTFTPPAPDNFTFTPPAGAKVEEKSLADLGRRPEAGQERAEALKGEITTVGEGWTTVAVLPFSAQDLAGPAQQGGRSGGQDTTAVADALLKSAKQVSGAWGSGKVIQTKLVSALLTDDGRLLVGAVTPEKLTEAAGQR
ncbi:LolA family protein [Streptosporangium roseum]|uniref:Outer membrane lipoprotein-sorting protein-like protein n=1 Tax=Streptosporangium roseum (strain ATCC 12428 / DSM 43021 / JCM 3005 / KCTC 9067 / NCIMB 10171 / NRRL 2505 / NI 9100) TaxID=479432 RepID=D2BF00_STRRD|nr:outer membrane lipoprotein carrier protein LolA [Streptosporangium roseum]ACZ86361.1 Outer membrane lipoprotein-sorting protein-like protein [Streptosporangium roseum DSM 43021]